MRHIKRPFIRKLLASILGLSMLLTAKVYFAKKNMFKSTTCLVFHNPTKKVFTDCINWLYKNNFKFLSEDDIIKITGKQMAPPPRAVWITIDDGWQDNIITVFPVLSQYNIPATLFLTSKWVEDGILWTTIARKFHHLLNCNVEDLWCMPENARQKQIDQIKKQVDISKLPRESLSISQLKSVARITHITFGAHTHNHVLTPNCNAQQLKYEIDTNIKFIKSITNKDVKSFAFPNGNYHGTELDIIFKNFKIAVSSEKRRLNEKDNPLLIPRVNINDEAFWPETLCQLTGAWHRLTN